MYDPFIITINTKWDRRNADDESLRKNFVIYFLGLFYKLKLD